MLDFSNCISFLSFCDVVLGSKIRMWLPISFTFSWPIVSDRDIKREFGSQSFHHTLNEIGISQVVWTRNWKCDFDFITTILLLMMLCTSESTKLISGFQGFQGSIRWDKDFMGSRLSVSFWQIFSTFRILIAKIKSARYRRDCDRENHSPKRSVTPISVAITVLMLSKWILWDAPNEPSIYRFPKKVWNAANSTDFHRVLATNPSQVGQRNIHDLTDLRRQTSKTIKYFSLFTVGFANWQICD